MERSRSVDSPSISVCPKRLSRSSPTSSRWPFISCFLMTFYLKIHWFLVEKCLKTMKIYAKILKMMTDNIANASAKSLILVPDGPSGPDTTAPASQWVAVFGLRMTEYALAEIALTLVLVQWNEWISIIFEQIPEQQKPSVYHFHASHLTLGPSPWVSDTIARFLITSSKRNIFYIFFRLRLVKTMKN